MKKSLLTLLFIPFLVSCGGSNGGDAKSSDNQTTPSVEYVKNVVTFTTKDNPRKIYAESLTPEGNTNKLPTIIFCHGNGNNRTNAYNYAKQMVNKGIAFVTFDFCGGAEIGCKSDGTYANMTNDTETEDLKEVVDYTYTLDFVDTENIYLMGESQGGFASVLYAQNNTDKIKGLNLLWPALNTPDDAITGTGVCANKTEVFKDCAAKYAGKVDEMCGKITNPIMLFHGSKDGTVPVSYSQHAAEVFPNCTYTEFADASHGALNAANLQTLCEKVTDSII